MAIQKEFKKVNYLKIDKDGYFYIRHKTPVEGSHKVELKNGGVVYHTKYVTTEYGKITNLFIKKVTFNNVQTDILSISIKADGKEETDIVDIPLYAKNSINPYVKGLVLSLDKITPDTKVLLSCSKAKTSKGFTKKAIYVCTDPERNNYIKGYEGHIFPAIEKVEKFGRITYDSTTLDNYIYKILQKQIEKFGNKLGTTESVTKEPVPKEVEKNKISNDNFALEEDDDELPF